MRLAWVGITDNNTPIAVMAVMPATKINKANGFIIFPPNGINNIDCDQNGMKPEIHL